MEKAIINPTAERKVISNVFLNFLFKKVNDSKLSYKDNEIYQTNVIQKRGILTCGANMRIMIYTAKPSTASVKLPSAFL